MSEGSSGRPGEGSSGAGGRSGGAAGGAASGRPGGADGFGRVCGHGESIMRGKYLLLNNLWGAGTGAGRQCLQASVAPEGGADAIAWRTEWDWSGRPDSVKSYDAAIVGWHWGITTPCPGLPVRVAELGRATTRWEFRLHETRPGSLDVAYDLWFARVPEPAGAQDLTDEIMVWLHRGGDHATPLGERRDRLRIEGSDWELWQGPHPLGFTVHSFVRLPSASSVELDLAAFVRSLAPRGLDPSAYLAGIEAGPEIFTGAGSLETIRYSVEVERA